MLAKILRLNPKEGFLYFVPFSSSNVHEILFILLGLLGGLNYGTVIKNKQTFNIAVNAEPPKKC